MKKREDHSTRAFTVGIKANRRQVRQAVQKLYGTDAAMVTPSSGLMERRRHARLAPDCDASEVADKIGII